ncbi:hypothetical protein HRW08_38985, partial [Streptomyces lunaelactis]|nr:hypothetical protein [Streptomyces lunaelactis]
LGDAGDARDVGGLSDVKAGPAPAGGLSPSQSPPLTIVVSEVPPPGEGTPEAAELLDGAGVDRAVVLGPSVTPDGAGRPVRAAVELTREGPGAPVRVRPLTGPPTAVMPDGTPDTSDAAFPGADVLMPLADALGPAPATTSGPATQSTATTDSDPVIAPATRPKVVSGATSFVDGNGAGPDSTATSLPAAAKLATLSRPWTDTATDLYLESGNSNSNSNSNSKGDSNNNGVGGHGPGGGRGPGNGGTPPPPPPTT